MIRKCIPYISDVRVDFFPFPMYIALFPCIDLELRLLHNENNLSLVLIEKIKDWLHSFLVYIDFWAMEQENFDIKSPNMINVVKLLIFFTDFVVTSVLRWVDRSPTHQNNVSLVLIEKINDWLWSFFIHRVLSHGYFLHYSPNWIYILKENHENRPRSTLMSL